MNTSPIISLRNVSKNFHLPRRKDKTVLSYLTHMFSSDTNWNREQSIAAVSDISIDVAQGEVLGIIGKNASGKTTVLRMIAGIVTPDSGTVHVRGSVTSLINLSVGLQARLSVQDNIYLACALFGMSRKETRRRFFDIIAFAELEGCVHMNVYQLSMGMQQRLAFSIAIHSEPEILVLDEVFSAGDEGFRKKAEQRMEELIRSDVTVVMVSHDLHAVSKLSDRILWVEHGAIRKIGNPFDMVREYKAACNT